MERLNFQSCVFSLNTVTLHGEGTRHSWHMIWPVSITNAPKLAFRNPFQIWPRLSNLVQAPVGRELAREAWSEGHALKNTCWVSPGSLVEEGKWFALQMTFPSLEKNTWNESAQDVSGVPTRVSHKWRHQGPSTHGPSEERFVPSLGYLPHQLI